MSGFQGNWQQQGWQQPGFNQQGWQQPGFNQQGWQQPCYGPGCQQPQQGHGILGGLRNRSGRSSSSSSSNQSPSRRA